MRLRVSIGIILLTTALVVCALIARRKHKRIASAVSLLVGSLVPPVIGNLIIIGSSNETLSTIGCYIYFLGMDMTMFALLNFTLAYCRLSWPSKGLRHFVHALLCVDAIQLLLNPLFHHAFDTESVNVDGSAYYRLLPHIGQSFHRLVDYGIFFAVLIVFFYKMVTAPKIYFERYTIIFLSMLFTGIWETYYIFSRRPIDTSMIGFGVFGLLIFYFSIYYRPLRLVEQMIGNVASEMQESLFFYDAVGRCIWANQPGIALTGVEDSDECDEALTRIFGGVDTKGIDWECSRTIELNSEKRYFAMERHPVCDAKNQQAGTFLSIRDETEQHIALQKEKYIATHDPLTGLYTRQHLYDCVRERMRTEPGAYAICILDVNDFKMVNDVFGRDFGDYALCQIAESLRKSLPAGCLYGRFSGDIFAMCIPASLFDEKRAEELLDSVTVKRESMAHHLVIHQGVYEATERDIDVPAMFDRAHMALDTIKSEYKRHIAYYDDKMRERALWEQKLSTQLDVALAEGQIQPYLQAIVDNEGKVVGAEALVRWVHPAYGFLSPATFVPIFEKNGMIADMDKFMWRRACEILARWKAEGRDDLFISINISPKDFYFMDVVAELKGIIGEYGIDPSRLRVEITETVMMTDNENRINILNELKRSGFLVEMDDFGSGYSSLNVLKDMPVDVIKIDMLFLTQSQQSGRGQTILHSVMNMTNALGLSSLTEGVETEDQFHMLSDMGCKLFQGYYFSKPIPVKAFEDMFIFAA